MRTPYAILIGLALIAAALYFRQPSIAPAQAGLIGDVDGFECSAHLERCAVLHGDLVTWVFKFGEPNNTFAVKYRNNR